VAEDDILDHLPFRSLSGKEQEAVDVIDARNLDSPNNTLMVVCDYGSDDLKGFKPSDEELENVKSEEGRNEGARDLAFDICERFECLGVFANFSRLLIDPGLPLTNGRLIRKTYNDGTPISFNECKIGGLLF